MGGGAGRDKVGIRSETSPLMSGEARRSWTSPPPRTWDDGYKLRTRIRVGTRGTEERVEERRLNQGAVC